MHWAAMTTPLKPITYGKKRYSFFSVMSMCSSQLTDLEQTFSVMSMCSSQLKDLENVLGNMFWTFSLPYF